MILLDLIGDFFELTHHEGFVVRRFNSFLVSVAFIVSVAFMVSGQAVIDLMRV